MEKNHIDELYLWFNKYFDSFTYDDDKINSNLINKKLHTLRVCENIVLLSKSINLSDIEISIAEVIALFHDIGRFEQFAKYKTFKDSISVDHANLGVKILKDCNVFKEMPIEEKKLILEAIWFHNKYQIPNNLSKKQVLFCKLIRDADKLDIFNLLIDSYENPHLYKNEAFEEFIDSKEYQMSFVDNIINGKKVSYDDVKTKADIKLVRISWIFDINFNESLRIIEANKYVDRIIKFLPNDDKISNLHRYVNSYLESKISR